MADQRVGGVVLVVLVQIAIDLVQVRAGSGATQVCSLATTTQDSRTRKGGSFAEALVISTGYFRF
jgi:hypothetical protein